MQDARCETNLALRQHPLKVVFSICRQHEKTSHGARSGSRSRHCRGEASGIDQDNRRERIKTAGGREASTDGAAK